MTDFKKNVPSFALATLIISSTLLFAAPALAAGNPYVSPTITLSPTHGPTGTVVTVTGAGFNPGVGISLSASTGSLSGGGAITTSSSGGFTATVTVTAAFAPKINIKAMGSDHASIPRDTATAQFTVDNVQAGKSDNVKLTGGSATQDDTSTTGVSVSITGATGISNVTVSTSSTNSPDFGVSAPTSGAALYFDIKVTLPSGATAPAGATVNVCFTDPTVASGMTLQYFDGTTWQTATGITVSGTQICGTVPLSALTGTNFAAFAAGADYTWVYVGVIVVALAVIVAVGILMWRRRT